MRKLLMLTFLVASPATATPTYLTCNVTNAEGKVTVIDVSADEPNGTVTTVVKNTGFTEKRTAVFSAGAVRWLSPLSYGGVSYDLSRTDLSIVRVLTIGSKAFTEQGSCKIQEAPKRAF